MVGSGRVGFGGVGGQGEKDPVLYNLTILHKLINEELEKNLPPGLHTG